MVKQIKEKCNFIDFLRISPSSQNPNHRHKAMSRQTKKLNDKQQRFVEEYLVDLNATQAALRAGYSKKTAYSIGSELLKKPEIQKALVTAKAERTKRTEITADRVLRELAKIGFSDIRKTISVGGNLISPSDWDDDTAGAISSIEVVTRPTTGKDEDGNTVVEHLHKINSWNKIAALEKIGKHLGMFVEKIEHSGQINIDARDSLKSKLLSTATARSTSGVSGQPDD